MIWRGQPDYVVRIARSSRFENLGQHTYGNSVSDPGTADLKAGFGFELLDPAFFGGQNVFSLREEILHSDGRFDRTCGFIADATAGQNGKIFDLRYLGRSKLLCKFIRSD